MKNLTVGSTPQENRMITTNSWVIPQGSQIPTSIAVSEDSSVWIATWSQYLLHISPNSSKVTPLRVMNEDNTFEVPYVAVSEGNKLWVILDNGVSRAATWYPTQARLEFTNLAKEPRSLAWIKSSNSLWYIATDLSLNIYAKGEEKNIDNGKYNALVVAEDGKMVAVRQSETDDVLIRSPEDSSWTKVRSNFGGEIVGFGKNNSLLLLEVGLVKKGSSLSDSRLLSIQKDGVENAIAVGSIIAARVQGNKLVTVRRTIKGDMTVEMITLN
jgi:hypothetical protein